MTRLLFDPRTIRAIRSNVATILIWLLASPSVSTQLTVSLMIEAELKRWWVKSSRLSLREDSNKRRRRETRKAGRNRSVDILKCYDEEEIEVIGRVLAQLPASSSEGKHATFSEEALRTLTQEVENGGGKFTTSSARAKCYALLIWYLQSRIAGSCTVPINLTPILRKLVAIAVGKKSVHHERRSQTRLTLLRVPILSLLRRACDEVVGNQSDVLLAKSVPIDFLRRLVSACTALPSGVMGRKKAKAYRREAFAAIDLLGSLGRAIPDSCSDEILMVCIKSAR